MRHILPDQVRVRLFRFPLAAALLGMLAGWLLYVTVSEYGDYRLYRVIRSCLSCGQIPGVAVFLLLFYGYFAMFLKQSNIQWWRSLADEREASDSAAE